LVKRSRTRGPWRWRTAFAASTIVFVSVAVSLALGTSGTRAQGAAAPATPDYYLDLGGSGSVGYQPTIEHPGGQRTDSGYANDLLAIERTRWPDLQLVQFGCPGETTTAFESLGDSCRPPGVTQLAQALNFLSTHHTVLMTVDLGFNNLLPCFANAAVDMTCVTTTIGTIRVELARILADLQAAATDPHLRIVGVGHYDPYLAEYLRGGTDEAFALDSVNAIVQLNSALRDIYGAAGVPIANVADPFEVTNMTQVPLLSHVGLVPQDVERTCTLTWNCDSGALGPNPHPDDEGYEIIAEAIADKVPA
jgi:hypothetical protein